MQNNLRVIIWGREVGRLFWDNRRKRSVFEYNKDFLSEGVDIAPLTASITKQRFHLPFFGHDNDNIFHGLPPFISDSLPGRWGNTVFSAWAQANGIRETDLTPVDKLSFIGSRAMGALEFEPYQPISEIKDIVLEDLYLKAQEIEEFREGMVIESADLSLESLYEIGTSAGGQHTKAIIARNNETGQIRSGQISLPGEYTYYLLKFAEREHPFMPVVEYIYYKMAQNAGIDIMPSELIEIGGERHFLTERFDRNHGHKIHVQSLAAMNPDANSYEDLMYACADLNLDYTEKEEIFRRIVFNILTTNTDAHIKNFAFTLEEGGDWHISPAYDLTFSCLDTTGRLVTFHSLRLGGKNNQIRKEDILAFALLFSIKNPAEILQQVTLAVKNFRQLAEENGLQNEWIDKIERYFAEQNPEFFSDVTSYQSLVYSFEIDGFTIKNATWEEMPNGAMRLTAIVNGVARRITLSPKSSYTRMVKEEGGIKMSQSDMATHIRKFFLNN